MDSDKRRDLPRFERRLHIVGGQRELEGPGVAPQQIVDYVDLLDRGLDKVAGRQVGRHEDRPELSADAALPQPRDIGVEVGLAPGYVDLRQRAARPFPVLPRQVIVPIDQRSFFMQSSSAYEKVRVCGAGDASHVNLILFSEIRAFEHQVCDHGRN